MITEYRFPSVKALMAAFRDLSKSDATLMCDLAHGKANSKVHIGNLGLPSYLYRYNRPGRLMHIFNHLLEMHGVESFATTKQIYQYCNTGDSYALTIVYCEGTDTFRLTSWGDIAEREPSRDLQDAILRGL